MNNEIHICARYICSLLVLSEDCQNNNDIRQAYVNPQRQSIQYEKY